MFGRGLARMDVATIVNDTFSENDSFGAQQHSSSSSSDGQGAASSAPQHHQTQKTLASASSPNRNGDPATNFHSMPEYHPDEAKRSTSTNTKKNGSKKKLDQTSKFKRTLNTAAGVAGNVLEWYDFAVFGYFSDIIADVFFPPQGGHAALIESFAVFGGAFVMRPLGGLLMGYIGDMYGRKLALEISIFLMAVPTFAMGCLPTFDQVGYVSTFLLVLVRLVQGLSVGGQLMSSLVFTVEQHPSTQWGYYGSLVMATANFGTLMGGVVGFLMRRFLTEEQLMTWGWRVPFLSGILVSICGFYLRMYGEESDMDAIHEGHSNADVANGSTNNNAVNVAKPKRENPIIASFRPENRRPLLSAALVPGLWTGGFYIGFVWMAIYMSKLLDNPVPNAFAVNSGSLFLVCIFFPIAGWLSDLGGRRKIMYMGGVMMVFGAPVVFYFLGKGDALSAFAAQSFYGISLSLWGAPMCSWLVEAFPPQARLTAVSIGYNLAQAIIGGSCPSIATVLVDERGPISPGFFVSGVALLGLFGLCIAPKSFHKEQQKKHKLALLGVGTESKTDQAILSGRTESSEDISVYDNEYDRFHKGSGTLA